MKKVISLILLVSVSMLLAACGGTPDRAAATPTIAPVKDSATIKAEGKLQPRAVGQLEFCHGRRSGRGAGERRRYGQGRRCDRAREVGRSASRRGTRRSRCRCRQSQRSQVPRATAPADRGGGSRDPIGAGADCGCRGAANDPAAIAAAEAARLSGEGESARRPKMLTRKCSTSKLYGPTEEQARLVVETAKRDTEAAKLRLKQLKSGSASYHATGRRDRSGAGTTRRGAGAARSAEGRSEWASPIRRMRRRFNRPRPHCKPPRQPWPIRNCARRSPARSPS